MSFLLLEGDVESFRMYERDFMKMNVTLSDWIDYDVDLKRMKIDQAMKMKP